jgi:hypothetical protein
MRAARRNAKALEPFAASGALLLGALGYLLHVEEPESSAFRSPRLRLACCSAAASLGRQRNGRGATGGFAANISYPV